MVTGTLTVDVEGHVLDSTINRYVIRHAPSDDECEADSMKAARLAAETLIQDNDWKGTSRIYFGDPRDGDIRGIINAGVEGSYALGGWWKVPDDER